MEREEVSPEVKEIVRELKFIGIIPFHILNTIRSSVDNAPYPDGYNISGATFVMPNKMQCNPLTIRSYT